MNDSPDAPFFDDDDEEILQEDVDTLLPENRDLLNAVLLLEENLDQVEDPVGMYIVLYDLHNELEQIEEAGAALVEAAKRVDTENHSDLVFFLYNQLELFSQLNPDAQFAYERLGQLIADEEEGLGANTTHLDQRKLYQVDLVPEILLAQLLQRVRAISDEEFRIILQDLCWCINREPTSPRTLQYVLEDRGLPHREKAIETMARDSGTPYIDLKLVNIDTEVSEVLPREFSIRRAAVVIGEVGGEPLVALLNPYNLQLREDLARMIDSDPHYLLASAEGYTHVLEHPALDSTP